MFGIDTNFHCPNCKLDAILNLGVTYFVDYKGEKLALHHCPKCGKQIAFKIVNEDSYKLGHARLNAEGKVMKVKMVEILSSNIEILTKSEEDITNFVLNKLKETFTEGYLNQNAYEVHTILEYVLANKLYVESFVYDNIKENCQSAGCVCF